MCVVTTGRYDGARGRERRRTSRVTHSRLLCCTRVPHWHLPLHAAVSALPLPSLTVQPPLERGKESVNSSSPYDEIRTSIDLFRRVTLQGITVRGRGIINQKQKNKINLQQVTVRTKRRQSLNWKQEKYSPFKAEKNVSLTIQ